MRISDWSSDVCSSDLRHAELHRRIGNRGAVVAAGCRDHTRLRHLAGQQIGKGAAYLEGAGVLQELKLEIDRLRGETEVGEVGGQHRRMPDVGPDAALRLGDAGAGNAG